MNPLNMPGFTADASLYLTGGSYRSVAAQSNSSGEHRVVAQRIARDGGCVSALNSCSDACTVWPDGVLRYYCQSGCVTTFQACTRPGPLAS